MTSAIPYERKAGDTKPVTATLRDAAKRPIPLVGADVLFIMDQIDGPKHLEAACTVLDDGTTALRGRVEWTPTTTSLTEGVFNVEHEITHADGGVETVPNSGYDQFVVFDDLN